jgi:hypothetical protein
LPDLPNPAANSLRDYVLSSLSKVNLLPVPPPVLKTPHPGKPMAFLLIIGPVKNRQVNHLAVQVQGKTGDLSVVHIEFVQFDKIFWGKEPGSGKPEPGPT